MLNIICCNIEVRQLKNFNEAEFLRDLRMIDWNCVATHNNPNELNVGVLETPVSECY